MLRKELVIFGSTWPARIGFEKRRSSLKLILELEYCTYYTCTVRAVRDHFKERSGSVADEKFISRQCNGLLQSCMTHIIYRHDCDS